MRVLVLGGTGMLGHKVVEQFRSDFDVWCTIRGTWTEVEKYALFDRQKTVTGVDARAFDTVLGAVAAAEPDVIINCIGVIKQLPSAKDPIVSLELNSLFPHRLRMLSRAVRARLIHISTDCVFSGRRGMYEESDPSDAEDLYGRSKFLGEVSGPGALTLRTSIIGRELQGRSGLVEWFLGETGAVKGFSSALFSGLTTVALTRVIRDVLLAHGELSGVYQVASDPITKYDLLLLLKEAYDLGLDVRPSSEVKIDRSLDGTRFNSATGFRAPSWPEMIAEMAADAAPYEQWRLQRATGR